MGDLRKVGDVVSAPSYIESIRTVSLSALSVTITASAVMGNTGGVAGNMRAAGLLLASGAVAVTALRDAIKPDEEEEARATQRILETEAAELRAEAIDAWKNDHLMSFVRGERPSDEWVESWVRTNFGSGQPALPPSSAQEFAPQFATAPAYDEYELDDDYDEPAPMMQAPMMQAQSPMVQPMAQPPIAPQFQPPASQPTNWLKEAVERRDEKGRPFFPHYNLAGTTGDGKTTTADFIARTFMAAHGSKPYLINPKHKPLEPEWSIEPECEDIEDVLPHLSRCLADMNERRSIKNPEGRLIIIDEIDWIINTYGNEAKKAVQSLFKVGRSVGINLLLVGQSPLATDTGFSGADFRNFFRMVLSSEAIPFLSNSQFPYPEMKEVLKGKAAEIQASTRYWGLILPKGERPSIKAMPHLETPSGITYFTRSQSTDRPVAQPHQPIAPAQPAPPRSPKQPMLQLMPQGGIMDDRPTTTSLMLPEVTHYQQSIGGATLTLTDPALLDLLTSGRSPYLPVIVRQAQKGTSQAAEGTTTVREIQSKAPHNKALQSPNGTPFTADIIRRAMAFLAESYPRSFVFDGQTLTIIDPALIEADI